MAIDESSEKTAWAAAEELIRNVKAGGCVDEHLQDQVRQFIDVSLRGERVHNRVNLLFSHAAGHPDGTG